jgi:hypothetical protein
MDTETAETAKTVIQMLFEKHVGPDIEFIPVAGAKNGVVQVWYDGAGAAYVRINDGSATWYDFNPDLDEDTLPDYLIPHDATPAQIASIKGLDAVPEAKGGDRAPFGILEWRYYYSGGDSVDFVRDDQGDVLEFDTIEQAKAWIDHEEGEVYCTSHNEVGRPTYRVVCV